MVGTGYDETGSQAFRWTHSGGIQSLGDINGQFTRSFAFGVNADGSVVVGRAEQPDNVQGFRWTGASGMVGVGGKTSELNAVTPDGSIAVGRFDSAPPGEAENFLAAIWEESIGLESLPIAIDSNSNAFGISAGENFVVVGVSQNHAFRFADPGIVVDIDPGGDTPTHSIARDVSDDGTVVVGDGGEGERAHAFRWTAAAGAQPIAPGETLDTFAYATDADGSVIVGQLGEQRAFIWDDVNGLRDLQNLLVEKLGVGNLTGWTLERAFGISGDGRTIVGDGKNPSANSEAWIVTLPSSAAAIPLPSPLAAGGAGLVLASIFCFRRFGRTGHAVK